MVDFHTHILPNIDDGSKSEEESFTLLKEARNAGFDKIISTSHYIENYYEVNAEKREELINNLQNKCNSENIDIKIYIGSEIYITENIVDLLEKGCASTINNTSYVLFEMPFNIEPLNLCDIVYEMLQNKLIPILAHPERYKFVQKKPELIIDLIEKGVLMQSNFGSVIGQYGKKEKILVKKFLENHMVHFLGSDVHKTESIYPKIPKILKELNNKYGEEYINKITTVNPELVLQNKKIDMIEEPPEFIHFSSIEKLHLLT